MRTRALLAVVALAGVACGTRADFSAPPAVTTTEIVEEVVAGAPSGQTTVTTGGGAPTSDARTRRPALRAGSGLSRSGTIVVGGLFPMSGGLSALGVPPAKAAQAYFRHVNARGGIGGYTIDFRICDDEADPNLSAACVDRLVNQGAFIIGPSFTPFSGNVVPILQRKGVPWIGYDGINVEGFSSPLVVTVGAPIEAMGHALLPYWYRQIEATKGRAPRRLGVVYLDVAPSRTYVAEARSRICPALGCEIVAEQRVTYFDLDYSSVCLKMRAAEVDGVWIVTDPASAVKLLVQCRELRYKPPLGGFLGQHGIYLDLTMEQSGAFADGIVANSALLPPSVDVPAVREMKAIVARYERDVDWGYFTALGYASARATEDVLRAALARDPKLSRASVLDAAGTIRGYDCHGLCRDVNLAAPAGTHGGNHTVWMVRSRYSRTDPDQWVLDGGPVDAWRSETWPRPGRP